MVEAQPPHVIDQHWALAWRALCEAPASGQPLATLILMRAPPPTRPCPSKWIFVFLFPLKSQDQVLDPAYFEKTLLKH